MFQTTNQNIIMFQTTKMLEFQFSTTPNRNLACCYNGKTSACLDQVGHVLRIDLLGAKECSLMTVNTELQKMASLYMFTEKICSKWWLSIIILPSGKRANITNWKDPPCLMGKLTISMAMFHVANC